MTSILKEGKIYLKKDIFLGNEYVLAIGISKIQGYIPISFYINFEQLQNTSIKFSEKNIDGSDGSENCCYIYSNQIGQVWTGVPYEVKVVDLDGLQYIDISPWIYNYSPIILISAYMFIDSEIDMSFVNQTGTEILKISENERGVRLEGSIRSGDVSEFVSHSINYSIQLYPLDKEPMIGRVADSRIGYFYDKVHLESRNRISGDPIAIIYRKNLDKAPWKYVIDKSIPMNYHHAVKKGVLSWNNYFEKLGLGSPFTVESCPEEGCDVFDAKAWYILGTEVNQFNGPYSGFCSSIHDYRSGENLFGLVSLNLIKIASNPSRFMKMNGLINTEKLNDGDSSDSGDSSGDSDELTNELETYIEDYISWVTAHEVGHQLGLRHNFMGNDQQDGWGSVMDYADIFNDFTDLRLLDVQETGRQYDLKAIEYGYRPLDDEINGIKHPELNQIASQMSVPFGTDENYAESINPYVGMIEDRPNPLEFIDKAIEFYKKYRSNIIQLVQSGEISSYEYNTMFIYLYTSKYAELINIGLRFIGGRYYDKTRTEYHEISRELVFGALSRLLKLFDEFEYTGHEYAHFIYDYSDKNDRQTFNRLEFDTLYSMNTKNLYTYYQSLINDIYQGVIDEKRLVRLHQNGQISPVDVLVNMTFAYKGCKIYDIKDVNGVFPEVGACLAKDSQWQELLFQMSPYQYNRQYSWIMELSNVYAKSTLYIVKDAIRLVLDLLRKIITNKILPYIESLDANLQIEQFWKDPQLKLATHWNLLLQSLPRSSGGLPVATKPAPNAIQPAPDATQPAPNVTFP
jgi:hypothetical protein